MSTAVVPHSAKEPAVQRAVRSFGQMADYVQGGMDMRRFIGTLIGAVVTAVVLAGTAGAIPDQGTPEFDNYMQALQRNGFNLNPDTAWRVAHQACEGGLPGFIGWEMLAQGVVGPGAQQRLMNVAMQYACPVQ